MPWDVPPATSPSAAALPRWRLPIVGVLVLALPILTAAAVASVLALGIIDSRAYTHTLVHDRATVLLDSIVNDLASQLNPVAAQIEHMGQVLSTDLVHLDDRAAVVDFVSGALIGLPQAAGLLVVHTDGSADAFRRDGDRIDYGRWPTVPPEVTRLLEQGSRDPEPRWVRPIWTAKLNRSIVVRSQPLYGASGYRGTLIVPVTIDALSRVLARTSAGFNQTPFILFDRDHVLAHPKLAGGSAALSAERPLPTLAEVGDPVLARLWDPASTPLPPADRIPGTDGRRVRVDGATSVVLFRAVANYGEQPWMIGSHFRQSEIDGAEMARFMRSGLVGGAVLVLAVLLSMACGRLIGRPIRRLAHATREIEKGNFGLPRLTGNPIREFDQAARAFNDMVDGLRDRERIRDLFGRYVPPEVVETVLADPEALELGGQKREITVLFSDIEGFTALSEGLSPDRVLALLNAYFEGVGTILVAHSGIIVDFVGDAVFAVFGATIAHADHARRALAAAREVDRFARDFSAAQQAAGLGFGGTRIGIHTGVAIVGNIGSHDRLKYGAAGDVVNTAARLEGANKAFSSRILASAVAIRHAGDPDVRPMGSVIVKGRHAPVEVCEVLETGASASAWHAEYLAAFDRLGDRSADAAAALRRLLAERPHDRAMTRLLDRLERGAAGAAIELTEK
jgi:class 3 adenylate cyclase